MERVIRTAVDGKDAESVIRCGDGALEGKYFLGVRRGDGFLVAAFDTGLGMRRRIAERHGLHPPGGGWCRLDPEQRLDTLGGASRD